MEITCKQRNPSQCREWERQRRNKFNDAINKLGEIVKAMSKSQKETDTAKDADNVKFPKIEIIQKAIICLTNSSQEKTQLKAEILALQVKLETIKDAQNNRKDASTQAHFEINKKIKSGKFVKLLKKKQCFQLDSLQKDDACIENKKNENEKVKPIASNAMPKLPTILPRCNIFDKKASENTIVIMPATPYIFPQRPFLLPSLPPAFVVLDHNIQSVKKAIPIVSRNSGDITKTTMVNILPISAYSRPLSATKQKKSNVRLKSDVNKKVTKRTKSEKKVIVKNNAGLKFKPDHPTPKESKTSKLVNESDVNDTVNVTFATKSFVVSSDSTETNKINKETPAKAENTKIEVVNEISSKPKVTDLLTPSESAITKSETVDTIIYKTVDSSNTAATIESNNTSKKDEESKINNKNLIVKGSVTADKNKENKLPNILDATLCDNVVDGGNARLELAEEFLAASPTAAFLMSFPLVSGNRADSPAEETQTVAPSNSKDITQKRNDLLLHQPSTSSTIFERTNNNDAKMKISKTVISTSANKQNEQSKYNVTVVPKTTEPKITTAVSCNGSNENPFLSLPMPSLVSTTCALNDTTFGLDFESNLNKPSTSQPTSYSSNSNIFYKNDPFSSVKSTIYSTSSISSNHDFNGIGLYPCAMEKYASKNKSDFTNIDDNNVMKIGSSRLTYDIDLGWSHKSLDFVTSTSSTTFVKDNVLTTVTSSTPFSSSYNPFNPEFHVPLVSATSKKESVASKPSSSFADTITSFYSQASNLWPEEPFYNNTNVPKSFPTRHQNYSLPLENLQVATNVKTNNHKQYEVKGIAEINVDSRTKSTNNTMAPQINEKYTKKSPSKMHINWMTSEIRPMQSTCNPMHADIKEAHKIAYNYLDTSKRSEHNDTNYFPISMHNLSAQPVQEDLQVWPSARPLGTAEISIDPPPINLPTLVGDLALGPHDKKKSLDPSSRIIPQQDLQNCSNFFSVTQLMNRSSDTAHSRYQPSQLESSKPIVTKQNISHYSNDSNRKTAMSRIETHAPQPYIFDNPKLPHSYENMVQFSHSKPKIANKSEKNIKAHKNNYSAEALLRGGTCTQKTQDNSSKFLTTPQKYNDFNAPQDSSVAQVSHFPPIIDYSENSYTGQQFSGTSLYNTTTNTLSNSFYTNFMPASSNLMSSNYTGGPFASEFVDYSQSNECNFTNHKYEELKMRNNPPIFQAEKMPSNYKSSRRESTGKHKLECSKSLKESSKKYQSKRGKLNSDAEEWNDPSHPLWQNKPHNKKHPNLMSEELPFPNYVSNQMHSQYQPDFFNSHLMPSNMQAVGPNVDRSLSTFPITSRANFNLSTIFPEITMKVQ